MNARTFVRAIRESVYKNVASAVTDALESPPGRRPDAEIVRLSEWFHALAPSDRANVTRVADMAADLTIYNFLLVLDGHRAIEPVGPKGRLELFHRDEEGLTLLNDEEGDELTSLYKE